MTSKNQRKKAFASEQTTRAYIHVSVGVNCSYMLRLCVGRLHAPKERGHDHARAATAAFTAAAAASWAQYIVSSGRR